MCAGTFAEGPGFLFLEPSPANEPTSVEGGSATPGEWEGGSAEAASRRPAKTHTRCVYIYIHRRMEAHIYVSSFMRVYTHTYIYIYVFLRM